MAACRGTPAAEPAFDPNRFSLFSDTHVAGDRAAAARGIKMAENLERCVREVLDVSPRPGGLLVAGDCAYLDGRAEDYATLLDVMRPLREAGLPLTFALGNHDHRERFWEAAGGEHRQASQVDGKHVLVIAAPVANWFVLDSLDVTNKTPGRLGDEQLKWLAQALDASKDKPALVLVHHNPDERPNPSGLIETGPLLELLQARRQVKALFFGHSHVWNVSRREGLHLVNLPPTAYVFAAGRPSGWVDVRLAAEGMTLVLRCLDRQHAEHGHPVELKWRGAV